MVVRLTQDLEVCFQIWVSALNQEVKPMQSDLEHCFLTKLEMK